MKPSARCACSNGYPITKFEYQKRPLARVTLPRCFTKEAKPFWSTAGVCSNRHQDHLLCTIRQPYLADLFTQQQSCHQRKPQECDKIAEAKEQFKGTWHIEVSGEFCMLRLAVQNSTNSEPSILNHSPSKCSILPQKFYDVRRERKGGGRPKEMQQSP